MDMNEELLGYVSSEPTNKEGEVTFYLYRGDAFPVPVSCMSSARFDKSTVIKVMTHVILKGRWVTGIFLFDTMELS